VEGVPWSRDQNAIVFHGSLRFEPAIQLRSDQIRYGKPPCPRGCRASVHGHGSYSRHARCSGQEQIKIPRYICRGCGQTISILPNHLLPYRHVHTARFEAFADRQAGVGQGPDPPPDAPEAGTLRRAWARFSQRVGTLRDCFGQLMASGVKSPSDLWIALRQAKQSLNGILLFLAHSHKTSLLGDYRCLRPG